jgi:hypothetical protein
MALSKSILSRLQFQHLTIEELIDGYNEEQLRVRNSPDKWSVYENIVHLVSYQLTFLQRIHYILNGNSPLIERYVAENDPLFTEYLGQSLQQLLQDLNENRTLIYERLAVLDTPQLACVGLHPVYGNLTLVQWCEFFLLHEAHHFFTIFKLICSRAEGSSN